MADKEPLAQSLSEEEELSLPPAAKKGSTSTNSSSPNKHRQGYKFTTESTSKPDNFDFATKSKKNGQGPNNNHSTSSSEGEDFEHLTPETESSSSGGEATPKPPFTPGSQAQKLPTPHKRTAELAENGDDAVLGQNGSPPSSPAAKKRKNWQEFVAEDEAKRQQRGRGEEAPRGSCGGKLFGGLKKLAPFIPGFLLFVVSAVALAYYVGPLDLTKIKLPWLAQSEGSSVKATGSGGFSWKRAGNNFINNLKKLEAKYPNQNRETWIQLHSSIISTLEKTEPEHPAAITILVPPSVSLQFATCFAKQIGQLVNTAVAPILQEVNSTKLSRPFPPKILAPADFQRQSITDIRLGLDNYLRQQGKSIVALQVTDLKQESYLLLFHGLCDNFRSVDKRATVLFPVEVPSKVMEKYEWTHARAGDISSDVLNSAFAKVVSADTGPALVARIADAVILLNQGDKCD